MTGFAARLAAHPDGERLRLRLGTMFIERQASLWPEGVPEEATSEFIREHIGDIVDALDQALHHDGRDARRLPRRLHWILWMLHELDRDR
jgi:hypothetical protein